tara:strand:- start:371 stop:562 length:192 start_codon:yes stop_codon:yes gene_type:complete
MAKFKVSSSRRNSRGLGDSIEKLTKATGIKSIVEKGARALGKDCGCSERRDSLNRMFPYKKNK